MAKRKKYWRTLIKSEEEGFLTVSFGVVGGRCGMEKIPIISAHITKKHADELKIEPILAGIDVGEQRPKQQYYIDIIPVEQGDLNG